MQDVYLYVPFYTDGTGGVVMEDRINILGIDMDCPTAKEAMLEAMGFMENDSVDTIEILSMDTLMNGQDDEEWKKDTAELKLILPGDAEILEAAEIDDRIRLKETQNRTFLKLYMKYLQKNQKKVFILAEKEEELARVEEAIRHYNRGIRLSGDAILEPDGSREESVINYINGTETDCILSVLSSPYQEHFIGRNRSLLNVKVWFGCGDMLARSYDERKIFRQIRHFFRKTMFRRRVEKQQREE